MAAASFASRAPTASSFASRPTSTGSAGSAGSSFKVSYLADGTRVQESLTTGDKLFQRPDGSRLKVCKDGSRFETFVDGTSKWTPAGAPSASQENTLPNIAEASFKETMNTVISSIPHSSATDDVERLPSMREESSSAREQSAMQQQQRDELAQKEQQANADAVEHYHLRALELERLLRYVQKKHAKTIKIKDQEINEQRQRAQKAREAEDAARVELQRIMVKGHSNHKAIVQTLKNDNARLQAATGPKVKEPSLIGKLLTGDSSAKIQAKMERQSLKDIARLEGELAAERQKTEKYKVEAQEYLEMASAVQFRLAETNEEVTALHKIKAKLQHKARALKNEKQAVEQDKEDLIIKAGWAAEQLQTLQADLEYERSKHVKQSRLTVVKQAEDLAKTKKENAALKRQVAELQASIAVGGKKGVDASYKDEPVHVAKGVQEAYVPPMTAGEFASGTLGQNTIAELVALKANQRAERAVKLDELIKKNKESNRKSEGPTTLEKIVRNALGTRRGQMGVDDDDDDSLSLSGSESDGDEADWS